MNMEFKQVSYLITVINNNFTNEPLNLDIHMKIDVKTRYFKL